MDDLLSLGAAELARRIRAHELNPVDVVEAHIRRIEHVNPRINAVVVPMFEQAREQARQAADRLAGNGTESLPPLFGVPVTIKDCFGVAGERFVSGSYYRRDVIAEADADAVRKLRAAGAIILGKTNVPDLCWLGETVNPVYGRTRNPWNPRRMVGGSSGGEGAIIAAGGSPLGLGSDVAGSLRIPAAACGVVSLKPSGGRISTAGHVPELPAALADWNTAGPMARRVEDLALGLEILSQTPVRDYRQIDLKGRRVLIYSRNPLNPTSGEVVDTVAMAAGALRSAGMEVVDHPRPPLVKAGFIFMGGFYAGGGPQAFRRQLGGGQRFDYLDEIRAHLRQQGRISLPVLYFHMLVSLTGSLVSLTGLGRPEALERARQAFLRAMTPGGVILCPVLTTPPPRHGWTWWLPAALPYTFMFNALGFPAACVPVRWSQKGLPLVVQVVAGPGEDETALAVAAELERVFGGWRIAERV
jgi:Asp-tRNA(Asn)/Glu-tRNA(Gln) amidotransferase A subunit family amidase